MLGPKRGQQTAPKSPDYHGCVVIVVVVAFAVPVCAAAALVVATIVAAMVVGAVLDLAVVVGLVVSAERARAGQSPQVALCTNCSFLALEIARTMRRTVRSGTSDPKPQTLRVPPFLFLRKPEAKAKLSSGAAVSMVSDLSKRAKLRFDFLRLQPLVFQYPESLELEP